MATKRTIRNRATGSNAGKKLRASGSKAKGTAMKSQGRRGGGSSGG